MDYATNTPRSGTFPGIEAQRVADALFNMFTRLGFPSEILSDLGSQFTSEVMKEDLISDFIFDFTAAGVVPCGGRKTSPRTSTIVQFIFYFGPLRSVIIF